MSDYIFVADEMGTPGMAPGTSNSFVFGGYVISENDLPQAADVWRNIKSDLCKDAEIELKWKHFFVEVDHPHIEIPLSTKDPDARRRLVLSVLDLVFESAPLIPVMAVTRKDRATDLFVVQSTSGKDKIDDDLVWFGTVAQFALFLDTRQATGELWFDRLGSEKHEKRRQEAWSEQLRMVRARELPPESLDNLARLLRIEEDIAFLDSKASEAVQIADFLCGVIWQAAEGDEAYLARLIDRYGPNASRHGLGILHVT